MSGGKRVTLKDVAEVVGLSTASVSYALRGIRVPVETQERVQAAADELGYHADPIARALASGRTGNIGVLCRSLEDMWQQSVAAGLSRGLREHGFQALIVDAAGDSELERSLAEQLVDQRVDGLIVMPVDPASAHWVKLGRRTVLVSLGDSLPGAGAVEVLFDNQATVTQALTQLADAGHRRVALLIPPGRATPDRPADMVARRVAQERGLELWVRPAPADLSGAAGVVGELLDQPSGPTGFHCLADSMAYGVYAASRSRGLRVPDDISVVGSDANQVSALLDPPLTGFRWPLAETLAATVKAAAVLVDDSSVDAHGEFHDRATTRQPLMFRAQAVEGGSVARHESDTKRQRRKG